MTTCRRGRDATRGVLGCCLCIASSLPSSCSEMWALAVRGCDAFAACPLPRANAGKVLVALLTAAASASLVRDRRTHGLRRIHRPIWLIDAMHPRLLPQASPTNLGLRASFLAELVAACRLAANFLTSCPGEGALRRALGDLPGAWQP